MLQRETNYHKKTHMMTDREQNKETFDDREIQTVIKRQNDGRDMQENKKTHMTT